MLVSPIHFTGRTEYLHGRGATRKESLQSLENELRQAHTARMAYINAPNYQASLTRADDGGISFKYTLDGEPADVKNNPITPKHITNLLENFYRMDKIGFYHRDLTSEHIFYAKNGKVQIDSFSSASKFQNINGEFTCNNPNIPPFIMPSNTDSFEAQGLYDYIDNIEDEKEQFNFIKNYLVQKSDYHNSRAKLLLSEGFDPSSKAVMFEKAKAEAYENPSDDVVNFEKTKLEVNYISKEADKMWKTGKGLKDGKLRPKKCFIAGCLMLYALKLSTELKSKSDTLTQNANKPCDRKYFEYQRECVELLGTNIFNKTKEICSSNFSNANYGTKGLFLGTPEDEQSFKKCLEQINMNENYVNTFYSIDKLLKSYAELTNNWTPENNALHKREYASKASVS